MVTSYVDDGVILVATGDIRKTKYELGECFRDCKEVAEKRGMDLARKRQTGWELEKGNGEIWRWKKGRKEEW